MKLTDDDFGYDDEFGDELFIKLKSKNDFESLKQQIIEHQDNTEKILRLKKYMNHGWVESAIQYKQNGDMVKFRNQIIKILDGEKS